MSSAPKSIKCNNIASLKAYLAGFKHQLDHKPNGQSLYRFDGELTLNIYDTGSVVFQGNGAASPFARQIEALIAQINAPLTPESSASEITGGEKR